MSLIEGELAQVEQLLSRLKSLRTPDSKLTSFIDRVKELDGELKLLIFTEYRATQAVLVEALKQQFGNDCVVTINGSMNMLERRKQVDAFNEKRPDPRFMVSTEAGGEGLNMQKSCHTVVNYDLPWNPMVLQQRIGRVYRYGQQHPVVVLNLEKSTARATRSRTRESTSTSSRKIDEITKKLQQVQDGDPEDLRSEVLGQVAAQISLDDLYKTAVEEGRVKAEKAIDTQTSHIEQKLRRSQGNARPISPPRAVRHQRLRESRGARDARAPRVLRASVPRQPGLPGEGFARRVAVVQRAEKARRCRKPTREERPVPGA